MDFNTLVPESWAGIIASGVAICAALATVLPPPAEGGSVIYRTMYRVIQWIGLNLGKATNAQDAKK